MRDMWEIFSTFVGRFTLKKRVGINQKQYQKLEKKMNTVDLQEASRDAQRALEQERDRYVDRITEVENYLKVMDCIDELLAENERLKEELESMREMYEEEKDMRTKLELELNETKKLAVGVANKTSQEAMLKVISTFVNRSKQKKLEKRTMVKSIVLEMAMTNGLTLPADLAQTIDALDDERVEAKVVNVSGNYNDIHDNRMVSNA